MRAKLFYGILYRDKESYEKVIEGLVEKFGEIETTGEEFYFSFTDYYLEEFGPHLKKRFIVFKRLIEREDLPGIKLLTCELEKKLADRDGKRSVNIDPGYITNDNVVVASTKEMPHRIYLCKGIFADLQLILAKGRAYCYRHTFKDYEANQEFFIGQRKSIG